MGFKVRWSSEAAVAGEGKAKRARAVRLRSKVESGKCEREVLSMIAVSILIRPSGVLQWAKGEAGDDDVDEDRRVWAAEMKSALTSTAEMCTLRWELIFGFSRHCVVRTRGPQALSRMRRGSVAGGREGAMRSRRWSARVMLQPPVRWL